MIPRWLYRLNRWLGDARALSKGPGPYARRLARRSLVRSVLKGARKVGL